MFSGRFAIGRLSEAKGERLEIQKDEGAPSSFCM